MCEYNSSATADANLQPELKTMNAQKILLLEIGDSIGSRPAANQCRGYLDAIGDVDDATAQAVSDMAFQMAGDRGHRGAEWIRLIGLLSQDDTAFCMSLDFHPLKTQQRLESVLRNIGVTYNTK
jgi:hypothetical protein